MGDMGEVDILEVMDVMDSEDGLAYWAMRAYRCTLRMSEGERREKKRREKKEGITHTHIICFSSLRTVNDDRQRVRTASTNNAENRRQQYK